ARVFKPRHAGQGDFQRNGDLALHLFGTRAGVLGDNFDDGRRRVGIGLDVDVNEGIAADTDKGRDSKEHDEWIADGPGNEKPDHGWFFRRPNRCACNQRTGAEKGRICPEAKSILSRRGGEGKKTWRTIKGGGVTGVGSSELRPRSAQW